jgi:hypothetical protein
MKTTVFPALMLFFAAIAPAHADNPDEKRSSRPFPGVVANLPKDVTTATVLSPEPAPTAPKGWRPGPRIGVPIVGGPPRATPAPNRKPSAQSTP